MSALTEALPLCTFVTFDALTTSDVLAERELNSAFFRRGLDSCDVVQSEVLD